MNERSEGNVDVASELEQGLGASQTVMAWQRLRRDRVAMIGLFLVVVLALLAVFAPVLAPYDPVRDIDLRNRLQGPSKEHWLGTDSSGRDVWSRILYGARI